MAALIAEELVDFVIICVDWSKDKRHFAFDILPEGFGDQALSQLCRMQGIYRLYELEQLVALGHPLVHDLLEGVRDVVQIEPGEHGLLGRDGLQHQR